MNWPGFAKLAGAMGVRSHMAGKCELCAVFSGESEAADDVEEETDTEGAAEVPLDPLVFPMEDFPLEQSRDETLQHAFGQVTDASNSGVGAVLSQQVEGVDRPVLYISPKLAQREVNYSTVEKECLAIQWAVGALRYYLLGRPFILWSDHAPLQWLHRMKDANARITQWYLPLQPFNFKVIHRPGNQMVVADFLSRSAEGGEESACGRRDPGLSRAVGVGVGAGSWKVAKGPVKVPTRATYAVAVPTKDQTAQTTARHLWTALIQPSGCPERFLTDRGGAFESEKKGTINGWVRTHHQTLLEAYIRVRAHTKQRQNWDQARYGLAIQCIVSGPRGRKDRYGRCTATTCVPAQQDYGPSLRWDSQPTPVIPGLVPEPEQFGELEQVPAQLDLEPQLEGGLVPGEGQGPVRRSQRKHFGVPPQRYQV
ncbi:uncharacterized protein LOC117555269 [Gymnodraco acuticeps]|uniref:Uncharacterized protein LOC117555269 n=1 Tax=Gymnodraco acuticeps TaxID=8218 RepID=A0A6P8V6Z0_GYMAC|nr:uncharacterized protein LOC117555269 [Gymnodraco acuticeps]